jgi:hypothetical protein
MLGGQLFGPGGIPLPNIFGLMGGDMGRSEGATAEKAVPFLCAARRSLSSRSVYVVSWSCLALRVERIVGSWSPSYVSELPSRTRSFSVAFATALLAVASSEASANFVCQAVGARSAGYGRAYFVADAKWQALIRCERRSGICIISYCVPAY